MTTLQIVDVDAQGADALALLHEAAIEARALYPELSAADAPGPTNLPTPTRGCYLIAYRDGRALACGALRPIDDETVELRRLFVTRSARRQGLARRLLAALEERARRLAYGVVRLETGHRQQPALALYEAAGFRRIPPFGPHVDDPTSVCFEKRLRPDPAAAGGTGRRATATSSARRPARRRCRGGRPARRSRR